MDEQDLIRERERAHKAKQILDNPIWHEAWEGLCENLRGHMESPQSSDEAVLEARRGLIVLQNVRAMIEDVMQTGQMAAIELERIKHGRTQAGASRSVN